MRKLWWVVAAIAALSACKKDSTNNTPPGGGGGGASPAATAEADKLWKLAPKGAVFGGVITGGALVQIDRGLAFVNGLASKLPGGGEFVEELGEARTKILGTAANYADAGIALDKGVAFFGGGTFKEPEGLILILPVGDREKFIATHGGTRDGDVDRIKDVTCKPVGDVYACAKTAADLVLGGGDLGDKAGVDGVRGDVELVMPLPALPARAPLDPTGPLKIAIGIKRGEIIARANLPAKLLGPLAVMTKAKRADLDVDHASGFLILPADLMDDAVPMDDAPKMAQDFFKSIAGPITAVIPAGVADVDIRMPLSDAGPSKMFIDNCGEISRPQVPIVKNPDGSCTVGPPSIDIPAARWLTGTVWLDGNTLRAARAKGGAARATGGAGATPIGKELAGYTFAYWGRGTMIGQDIPGLPPEARVPLAAMGYFSELGMGVKFTSSGMSILMVARSIHANPDDVVTAVEAAIGGGADATQVAAIAKAHPGTPFADDVAAGPMGVMVPTAGLGMLAAVAIPAFLEYGRKGKASEADLALARLSMSAKVAFMTNAAFPAGDSGRVPAEPACTTNGRVHPAGTDEFMKNPIFGALEFSIEDSFRCQYQYVGTEKEFTATAYCDLDCDTTEMKVIAHGTVDASGSPHTEFTREGTD